MAFETHSVDFHHEGIWVAFCCWLEQRGLEPTLYPNELQDGSQFISHYVGLKTKLS